MAQGHSVLSAAFDPLELWFDENVKSADNAVDWSLRAQGWLLQGAAAVSTVVRPCSLREFSAFGVQLLDSDISSMVYYGAPISHSASYGTSVDAFVNLSSHGSFTTFGLQWLSLQRVVLMHYRPAFRLPIACVPHFVFQIDMRPQMYARECEWL